MTVTWPGNTYSQPRPRTRTSGSAPPPFQTSTHRGRDHERQPGNGLEWSGCAALTQRGGRPPDFRTVHRQSGGCKLVFVPSYLAI